MVPSNFFLAAQCNYERNYTVVFTFYFIFSKTFVVALLALSQRRADKNSPKVGPHKMDFKGLLADANNTRHLLRFLEQTKRLAPTFGNLNPPERR